MSEQVQILHHVPGRIRIKVLRLRDKPQACKAIDDMAAAIQGVQSIKAHPVTGSVLVHYDKADPDVMHRLEQALEQLENFLAFIDPNEKGAGDADESTGTDGEHVPKEELILRGLTGLVDKSDRQIRQASGGAVNLATVLSLLLGAGLASLTGKGSPILLAGLLMVSFQSYGALQQAARGRSMSQPASL
jgi:hypothetical protein